MPLAKSEKSSIYKIAFFFIRSKNVVSDERIYSSLKFFYYSLARHQRNCKNDDFPRKLEKKCWKYNDLFSKYIDERLPNIIADN
jgi:hypothetical protein